MTEVVEVGWVSEAVVVIVDGIAVEIAEEHFVDYEALDWVETPVRSLGLDERNH